MRTHRLPADSSQTPGGQRGFTVEQQSLSCSLVFGATEGNGLHAKEIPLKSFEILRNKMNSLLSGVRVCIIHELLRLLKTA